MKYIVDRFEGDFVLCETENNEFITVERSLLPQHVKEGDVLLQAGNEFVIDLQETQKRKEHIKKLADELWM